MNSFQFMKEVYVAQLLCVVLLAACYRLPPPETEAEREARLQQMSGPIQYCVDNDCSSFPEGFVSLKIADEWHYFPSLHWLEAEGYGGVGTGITVSADGDYLITTSAVIKSLPEHIQQRYQRRKYVEPNPRGIDMIPCCDNLGAYFGVEDSSNFHAYRLRAIINPSGGISTDRWQRGGSAHLSNEELPVEFHALSDRYVFYRVASYPRASGGQRWSFRAVSKEPNILGGRARMRCSGKICQLYWSINNPPHTASFRVVNFILKGCPGECSEKEKVEFHFANIEQFLSMIEQIWEESKTYPKEIGHEELDAEPAPHPR